MTKEVELMIKGVQKYADHVDDDLQTHAKGEYYYRNGSHYVLYEEHNEGFTETTKSMLKLKDGVLEMTRKGLVNTSMVFEQGKETVSTYKTPFGEMLLGIRTRELQVTTAEDKIQIKAAYALEAEGRHMAECEIEVLVRTPFSKKRTTRVFEVMHMEKVVASFAMNGKAKICNAQFMPYGLYLDEDDENDIDILINNINNFNHWCASRVLSLDRKYAKEILNSINVAQATTDKDRAEISLSYHCVSLTDVYWVREEGEEITFSELNLYDNPLNEAIVDLSLKGRQMTVTNKELAPDLSTKGCFPKAWVRRNNGFKLLKDGDEETVKKELLASEICQCFDIRQVIYRAGTYDGELVSESDIVTSKEFSIVSKMAFDIYAINHDLDTIEICKVMDPITYYGMNILDYLTGNTDRHPENWGFLVDNSSNKYVSLYPLMDFNQCFQSYDNIDGANCLTVSRKGVTQREAAIEGVKCIGLRQKKEMDMSKFGEFKQEAEMFKLRMAELKKYI